MPVLSDITLAALLRRAHVGPGDAAYLVAIAHPESSANDDAVQQGQPYQTTGWGVWQITPGDSVPQVGVNHALLNPQLNAEATAIKLHEQGLGAWSTYTSGAFEPFFGAAKAAVSHVYALPMDQVDQLAAQAGHGGSGPQQAQTTGGIGGLFGELFDPLGGLALPFLKGAGQTVGDVGTAVADLANVIATFEHWMAWLFVPSHWIRILCFVLGLPLVGAGLLTMVTGSRPIPVNVGPVGTEVSGGSITPAFGIAEVTAGAVLLFIAFHNLPDNVQTFPQLLSHVQGQVQGSKPAAPAPRPAVA